MFTFYDYFTTRERVPRVLRLFKRFRLRRRLVSGRQPRARLHCMKSEVIVVVYGPEACVASEVFGRVWRERAAVCRVRPARRGSRNVLSAAETRAPPRAHCYHRSPTTIVPSPFR